MDFGDLINGILVLIAGGILGGIGTYFLKPPLDAWLEKRKKAREEKEAARKKEEEAAKQRQLADQYALDYRDKLVQELRNLRILDMVQPLDLERTYVRLKVQEEQPLRYADAEEMDALAKSDPNLLLELTEDRLAREAEDSFPPEEAIKRNRHLVVLGDPGAGKTTMLKYLCLLSARAKASGLSDFPMFVTLNRYAISPHDDLMDFIVDDIAERYGFPQLRPYLEKRLEDGSVLLLLDGLDEVTVGSPEEAETIYHRTANEINRLVTRYPKCPTVVTSRRAGWKGLLAPSFVVMAVLDFTWEDIQRFVNNWFGEGSNRARDLLKALAQQVRMRALAANPLLLSLIAIVFQRDLELPERRARLYERCAQVLLTEWDAHRSIRRASRFTTDRKRDLLEDIALHFHCQGARYFPKDELLEVITEYLPSIDISVEQAPLVLDEISAQHGLLKEQAAEWYGFLHLTLQEYFAAVSIDKGNRLDLALAHLHEPWWEEVVLLLAGMLKDATPLLEGILSDRDDIFFSNLLLAGRCLAGTPRIDRSGLREQIIAGLKTLIEDEKQHWLPRTQAVRTLSEADEERSSEYSLAILRNQELHWQVRAAAADALGASRRKAVVPGLLDLLSDEQVDRNIRERIADALIDLCDESEIPQLLGLLSDQSIDPEIRSRVARTLGYLGYDSVVPSLFESLLDYDLAWQSGRALVKLHALTEPKELLTHLRTASPVAGWALAKAVENMDPATAPEIVRWLYDNSIEKSVRWSIAHRLGHLGGEAVRSQLLDLFSDGSIDISIRASCAIALLTLGDTNIARELKSLLVNPDLNPYVRRKIAEKLVSQGERDITEQLMMMLLLQDENLSISARLRMANLLADIGDSTVAYRLLSFIRDEHVDSLLRARAADTLSTLELNGLTGQIRTLVGNEQVDSLVRSRLVYCLVQDENGATWLVELVGREDIGEESYLALYRASRQTGVRVFATPENGYEIRPLQSTQARC